MKEREAIGLKELLKRWHGMTSGTDHPQAPAYDGQDIKLTNIVEHTNHVEAGSCFIARVRTGTDGHPYIGRALEQGASLIVGQRDVEAIDANLNGVPYLQVQDSAVAEAWLAASMYNFPSKELVLIGVTGTDGKTTTTNLIFDIVRRSDVHAGMLSTIKASIGRQDEALALHVTTPEAPIIQAYLRRMVEAGLTHCVLEVTSHSLAQHRVDAVEFDIAVHTNITHEHLDYHGDYDGYFEAKSRLFRSLNGPLWNQKENCAEKAALRKTAVLNRDDASYDSLAELVKGRIISYGIEKASDVSAA
ncbi:MAG: Mur ligase family protein, partial [Candidatus Promineifilaceae bacterium]